MHSNKELFKQALDEAVNQQFDELAASCTEDISKLNAQSVKYIGIKLNELIDKASDLYLSDEDIPEELAEELANMWDLCRDYIAMYENCSRL